MDQHTSFGSGPDSQEGEFWAQFSEEWQEILAAYALGALEPEEMIALDDYLHNHPELQAVVDRLDETAAALAYGAPVALPTPDAKRALLDRVDRELQGTLAYPQRNRSQQIPAPHDDHERHTATAPLRPQRPNPESTTTAPQSTAISPYLPAKPLQPTARLRGSSGRSRWGRQRRSNAGFFDFATGWKIATMATAAALLFFIIATAQLAGQLNRLNQQEITSSAALATATAALDRAQAELATAHQENRELQETAQQLAERLQTDQQQLTSLVTVNQVVALGGTEFAPQAEGTLFVGEDSLVLVLRGLQPLPTGQTYQLWLIPADNAPVSAGLVHVSDGESPNVTTDVTLTTETFATVGLSVEPAGGSAQPTGNIVMLGNRT
ncbi:MAG: anti-sigma factor [Caldilineaceae bacterium]|nr:anti-sigma factor [Caldilineaceae bacterium]